MSGSVGFGFFAATLLNFCSAGTPKSDKSTQTKKQSAMVDWASLDVMDYLRSGALIVGFVVLLLSDKRGKANIRQRLPNHWVNAEVVASFVLGMIFYFFPINVLQYVTKSSLNASDQIIVQVIGVLLVCVAVTTARIQASIESDALVHSSWLLSRLMGSISVTLLVFIAHCKDSQFTQQHLTFFGLGLLLWVLGNIYQMFKVGTVGVSGPSRETTSGGVNLYLLLDLLLILPSMIVTLACPAQLMGYTHSEAPSSLTLHLAQVNATLILGLMLNVFGALYYDEESVKREMFFGRIVMMGMALPLNLLHQWKNSVYSPAGVIVMVVVNTLQCLLYYKGYTAENGKSKTG